MSMEEDLTRLVQATVRTEVENHMRTRSSELIGRGGDVVLGGMGNIYLQPGVNKKAYYKGVEIGTGSGGAGISGSGTLNYIPRFTAASVIGDSHLVDDGSTVTSSENVVINPSITPGMYLYAGGVPQGYLQSVSGVLDLNSQVDDLTIGAPSAKTIYMRISGDTKLSIGGSAITSSENVVINPSITPALYLYAGGVPQGYLQSVSGVLDLNSQVEGVTVGAPSAKTVALRIAGTDKLTVSGADIASKADIIIKEASPMLYFQDVSGNPLGSVGSLGGGFYIGDDVNSGSIYIRTGVSPVTRVQIYDTGVALGVPLAMSSNKITGLAAASANGDALRYEQLVGVYLPLAGGTLTNDLTIKDASPMVYFTDDSDSPLGSIGSLGGGFYIGNDVNAGSIYIRTGASPTTRMQIYDTGVALGVPLAMSSQKITGLAAGTTSGDALRYEQLVGVYLPLAGGALTGDISFTDGSGVDFRNDNVHKINYTLGSNTLDFSTYHRFDFLTTYDSSVDFSILYDSIIAHEPLYFRHAHSVSDCYIVDNATGGMELHVPSGQVVKIIVG